MARAEASIPGSISDPARKQAIVKSVAAGMQEHLADQLFHTSASQEFALLQRHLGDDALSQELQKIFADAVAHAALPALFIIACRTGDMATIRNYLPGQTKGHLVSHSQGIVAAADALQLRVVEVILASEAPLTVDAAAKVLNFGLNSNNDGIVKETLRQHRRALSQNRTDGPGSHLTEALANVTHWDEPNPNHVKWLIQWGAKPNGYYIRLSGRLRTVWEDASEKGQELLGYYNSWGHTFRDAAVRCLTGQNFLPAVPGQA